MAREVIQHSDRYTLNRHPIHWTLIAPALSAWVIVRPTSHDPGTNASDCLVGETQSETAVARPEPTSD
jgi:hypothetical protein